MSDAAETYPRRMPGWQKAGLLSLIAVSCVVGYMALFWHPVKEQPLPEPRRAPADYLPQSRRWADPPPPKPEPVAAAKPPMQLPSSSPLPNVLPQQRQLDPKQEAWNSPILGPGQQQAQSQPPRNDHAEATRVGTVDSDNTALGAALKATKLDGVRATRLKNPELTIVQGSRIPCVIENAFTTAQPGLLSCVVPIDVRGYGGHVILLPAGTKITGQYQSGIRQGQNRAFIVWTRAITPPPDAVVVDLGSPAADELGRAGLDGEIDTKFWSRFGSAMLLSFLDSGMQAAAIIAAQQAGGTSYFNSFSMNGQSVANTALQHEINQPPVLTFEQGRIATVFVARDLDFSGTYRIEQVR
ncbi:MAG: TrbI/VirB10 family protein [Acetobacteraceae bacterium]